jgi:hypothetical protein
MEKEQGDTLDMFEVKNGPILKKTLWTFGIINTNTIALQIEPQHREQWVYLFENNAYN